MKPKSKTTPSEYKGPERRIEMSALKEKVRMLEELDRAGTKSREGMHIQITELRTEVKEGFKEVARAVNDLGIELRGVKGMCPEGDGPCAKGEIPWIKQWLTWIGAGEVLLASAVATWILQHTSSGR